MLRVARYGYSNTLCRISSRSFWSSPFCSQDAFEIPRHRIQVTFARSSGPGGQNVNKVNTKVDLRFKVADADWLPERVREAVFQKFRNKINNEGELIITSQRYRTQEDNLKDAFEKLEELLREAAYVPPLRIPTEKPQYADEARLREKKLLSQVKEGRRPVRDWD